MTALYLCGLSAVELIGTNDHCQALNYKVKATTAITHGAITVIKLMAQLLVEYRIARV